MVFRNPFRRPNQSLTQDIASISALDDPIRAAILIHVSRSGGEVSRDQAAEAVGVTRRVAAFHLDRLAEDGWLEVGFRRLTGKTGPGAGRSSKLYRRSAKRVDVSMPVRNYELMARALGSAIEQSDRPGLARELEPGAREFGATVGANARARTERNASRNELADALIDELSDQGFEPFVDAGSVVRLRNCPYHDMARENSDLVCAMNLALLQGVAEGLELADVTAKLVPRDGMCCVAFQVPTLR
jgi:predicted ArsR family transcriptional regulator